ncbi:unnamed protein product [Citrullus colocynthis]|uniref:Uncharacterized protein n=1 Tax=Citrullus colocynthis TaxID=252529 RepID=A0ABP0Z984_9ROSI
MASTEIIPIIQHPFSSSSPTISATVDTMLIKEYGNKDGNQHPFFLQLTSQATAAANFKRQRRRRVSRESILPGHNVGHAVAVTFLAVRLCFRVLRCLCLQMDSKISIPWMLCCFYFPWSTSSCILLSALWPDSRSIKYGDQPRNRLDIYLPKTGHGQKPKPVVAFVTGGAWIMVIKHGVLFLGHSNQRET